MGCAGSRSAELLRFAGLNVQILHFQRVALNEGSSRFDLISHKDRKNLVCLDHILDCNLEKGSLFRVHRGLPELFRVHFAQTFVPLDSKPLLPKLKNKVDEFARIVERLFLALLTNPVSGPAEPEDRR